MEGPEGKKEETKEEKKTSRVLRRVGAVIAAVLAVPLFAWLVWDRVETSRLSRRLDVLFPFVDEASPVDVRTTPNPSTDAQRQAERLYAEAARLATPPPLEAPKLPARETSSTIEALSRLSIPEARRDRRLDELARIEDAYRPSLDLVDRAAALDAPAPSDTGRMAGGLRRLADVNAVRVARLAFSGSADSASQALVATLCLRRAALWRGGLEMFPTSHSLQVALTFAPPSDARLEQLQREYQAIDRQQEHAIEDGLVQQRYQLSRSVAPEAFGLPPSNYDRDGPLVFVAARLGRPIRDNRLIAELGRYDEAIAAAKLPWPARLDAADALAKKYGQPQRGGANRSILDKLFAVWQGVAISTLTYQMPASAALEARARVAAAVLGVERYRRAHTGALPDSLGQLVPSFLERPPTDPFSGAPLIFTRDANGYRIYSVGSNRRDDQGKWELTSDLNPVRRGDPKDIGIEVRFR